MLTVLYNIYGQLCADAISSDSGFCRVENGIDDWNEICQRGWMQPRGAGGGIVARYFKGEGQIRGSEHKAVGKVARKVQREDKTHFVLSGRREAMANDSEK